MNIKGQTEEFFKDFDAKYAYKKADLGTKFHKNHIEIKFWQPLALDVKLLIFQNYSDINETISFSMEKEETVWVVKIEKKYEGKLYQFLITHPDNSKTVALDPYAYSLAPFDWEAKEDKIAKGAIVNLDNKSKCGIIKHLLKTEFNCQVDPIIYELHIRDFTSLKKAKEKEKLGTFDATLKHDIFKYLKNLNITHVQLLPIHSTYSLNENNIKMLKKGEGKGWATNYNWGYDPLNYFSINGSYSTNPSDPYNRIKEFKRFVDKAHKSKIGVILDVVYNHMMINSIYDNILPGYYYRDNAKVKPVIYPPLASQRYMVRKLIYESLKHFVEYYDVDGFRFDLSSFIDKETLDYCFKNLRKIKPNLVIHGEAWQFSDLDFKDSYVKGISDNNHSFGYFNDSLRSIITWDEFGSGPGLITKVNNEKVAKYRSCVIGNINNYKWPSYDFKYSKNSNDLFTKHVGNNLAYVACHDGGTLWDRIITESLNKDLKIKDLLDQYRQALILQITTQGRQFFLAGTELAQSKPADKSGQDFHKSFYSYAKDYFELNSDENKYHFNSYKTTDYTNGLKWNNLENPWIKKELYRWFIRLLKFRQSTKYFRLNSSEEINKYLKFNWDIKDQNVVDYSIKFNEKEKVRVIHNFNQSNYKTIDLKKYKVLFCSKIGIFNTKEILGHCSYILIKK